MAIILNYNEISISIPFQGAYSLYSVYHILPVRPQGTAVRKVWREWGEARTQRTGTPFAIDRRSASGWSKVSLGIFGAQEKKRKENQKKKPKPKRGTQRTNIFIEVYGLISFHVAGRG
jgi:hypothetical protein